MKLIDEYTVLYFKLPEKKRNTRQDGVIKIYTNGSNITLSLLDDTDTEITRKNVIATTFQASVGISMTVGSYVVTFEEKVFVETNKNSQDNLLPIHSPTINKYISTKSIPPPQSIQSMQPVQSMKFSHSFKSPSMKTTSQLTNSNSSSSSLDKTKTTKTTTTTTTKPLSIPRFNPSVAKIKTSTLPTFNSTSLSSGAIRKPFIKPLLQQNTGGLKPERVFQLDSMIQKRMRPHQIEAVEWILNQLKESPDEKDLSQSTEKKSDFYLDFVVEDSEDSDGSNYSDDNDGSDDSDGFIDVKLTKSSSVTTKFSLEESMDDNVKGVILADEMGLGKTLTSIGVIWAYIAPTPGPRGFSGGKAIVVCPSSLIDNWEREVKCWLGLRIKPMCVKATGSQKRGPRQTIESFLYANSAAILIISYEMYRNSAEIINKGKKIDIIVCDEGHRLKNIDGTKTIIALRGTTAKRRLILSGTPIQNDLDELYAMVSFVRPKALGSVPSFQSKFSGPISRANEVNASEVDKEAGRIATEELKIILDNLVIRRTQAEVLSKFLPPKYEYMVSCHMSTIQLNHYKHVTQDMFRSLNISTQTLGQVDYDIKMTSTDPYYFIPEFDEQTVAAVACNTTTKLTILPTLLKLRRICNSVQLDSLNDIVGLRSILSLKELLERSIKLQVVDKILSTVFELDPPEKVVIVSNFLNTLDNIARLAMARKWDYLRLDGSTILDQRQINVDKFNRSDNEIKLFLLSSKAGGVGINLIGASRLIMFDCDWNPAIDFQAMSRIWREGQKKPVHIYRLVAKHVIEEAILMRQRSKSALISIMSTIDNDEDSAKFSGLNYKRMSLTTSDVINLAQPKYPSKIIAESKRSRSKKKQNDLDDLDNLDSSPFSSSSSSSSSPPPSKKRKHIIYSDDEDEDEADERNENSNDNDSDSDTNTNINMGDNVNEENEVKDNHTEESLYIDDPVYHALQELEKMKIVYDFFCQQSRSLEFSNTQNQVDNESSQG